MKKTFNKLFAPLKYPEIQALTVQVNEIIAFDLVEKKKAPVFTAADLWNIHRQSRTRVQRRYF